MVVSWDGSGHALAALQSVVGLFRDRIVEHIEIVIGVWPARDTAMWSDIQEEQFASDDLHQAAATVVAAKIALLEDALRPIAQTIASSTAVGAYADIVVETIARSNANMLFLILGAHDSQNVLEETLRAVVASKIVTCILRPPRSA
jgi:predicted anti-sigma-YlaC factor YlaD